MNVTLRLFEPADRASLLAAINAVCAEGKWMRTQQYESTPAWEHTLRQPHCACHRLIVAVHGHSVVGWCRAFPVCLGTAADVGIGLLPAYRGQGLGTAMLYEVVTWAYQAGIAHLTLTVRVDNARALHVFRKVGFEPAHPPAHGWLYMVCDSREAFLKRRLNLGEQGSTPVALVPSCRAG